MLIFSYENKEDFSESLDNGTIREEIIRYLCEGFDFCDSEQEYLSDEYMFSLVEFEYGICKSYVLINREYINKYKKLQDVILSARDIFLKQIQDDGWEYSENKIIERY